MTCANCCTMTCAPISLGAGVRILADRLGLGAGPTPIADLHGRGYAYSHLRLARHGITSLRESPACCVGTERALAEKSGVPVRTIQYWEDKGVSHATVGNLLKVTEAMGCTLDEIVRGDYRGRE